MAEKSPHFVHSGAECTKIAHRHSRAIFSPQSRALQRIPQWESILFVCIAEKSLFASDLGSQGIRGGVSCRDPKLNTNFFYQTFRAPPGYPGKIPGYPAKKSWVSRDVPNFSPPPPSRGRPPPHRKISQTKKVWVWDLCVPSLEEGKRPPPPRRDSVSGLY